MNYKPLGRKKEVTNEQWLDAKANAVEFVGVKRILELYRDTVNEIKQTSQGMKVAYAWSGGKDSIVLQHLCENAGITKCVIGLSKLEYPVFEKWIFTHRPKGLEVVYRPYDLEWLSKNQQFLFASDGNTRSKWYSMMQIKAQKEYINREKIDMIILGRRKKDGNNIRGKFVKFKTDRCIQYNPLLEWTHEELLAYIEYFNLELPPIYEWKDAYVKGTHPWALRSSKVSIEHTWQEIYDIDKSIVENASKYIESAKIFLEKLGGIKDENNNKKD